ncbi:DUF4377 domain-containing protein [Flavobacteriaceae bacterium R38]|nr:DUF4377 domain-containing protein [Flavobacteriaceae bacterium R38]
MVKKIYCIVVLSCVLLSCEVNKQPVNKDTLTGSGWRLIEIVTDNNSMYIDQNMFLNIDFTSEKISGMSACNTFFGSYKLKKDNEIEMDVKGTTLMVCEDNVQKYEDIFINEIEKIRHLTIDENTLYLHKDTENYLVFHRFQKIDNNGLIGDSFTKTIWVASETKECEGVGLQQCLLVKDDKNKEWELFYDVIDGFNWEKGYEYELIIEESVIDNPPADGSSLRWKLITIVEKHRK